MASEFHKKALEKNTEYIGIYVEYSMNILERINKLLDEKFQGNKKLLAERLGETEKQVDEWFNGVQNYTIRTISKLEVAFQAKII